VQINAVTKSGTNTFLGSFGAYFRDDNFNAADHIVDRVLPYGVDIYNNLEWYRTGHPKHRAVFNAIYELPGQVVLSGLYFYGDNGWSTTESGVDIHDVGGVIADRTPPDGSIIPLNG
jgi:hypothetical protein